MELVAKLGFCQSDSFRTFSLVGTEDYISPEVLEDREVTYACDFWSLGIILYQMLSGTTPFKGKTAEKTYMNIKQCLTDDISFKTNFDPEARSLILNLL
jgi:protein-serine/threonine kinase